MVTNKNLHSEIASLRSSRIITKQINKTFVRIRDHDNRKFNSKTQKLKGTTLQTNQSKKLKFHKKKCNSRKVVASFNETKKNPNMITM